LWQVKRAQIHRLPPTLEADHLSGCILSVWSLFLRALLQDRGCCGIMCFCIGGSFNRQLRLDKGRTSRIGTWGHWVVCVCQVSRSQASSSASEEQTQEALRSATFVDRAIW